MEILEGETLLSAAQTAGVQIISLCGGVGACESCRIRLISGELTPPTLEEQEGLGSEDLAKGFRLACQAIPLSDVKIEIPPETLTTPQRLQIEGQEIVVAVDPVVTPLEVQFTPPTLEDLRSDVTRVSEALIELGIESPKIGLPVLEKLSTELRAHDWNVRLGVRGNEVVSVLPPKYDLLGLAVDVGTTKLAAYVINLATGETLAMSGAMNPQISYGEDVISRIAYTNNHAGGKKLLQTKLVEEINRMVRELCAEIEASEEQIAEAVVVGNTVMHHLFVGLPVRQLGESPYVPSVAGWMEVPASRIGLSIAPGAYIYLPPNIAGYVGADHVAMLLATDIWQTDRTAIAVDIGTNTEISLAAGGRLLCCSCASGPAFEGAHIHHGMRAAPGAIERVQISEGEVRVHTIDNQPAVGICGSGILDAMAEMIEVGAMDTRGKLQLDHPLVRKGERGVEFLLLPKQNTGHHQEIVVVQKDVGEIQLAKGAIRAGIEVLLEESRLTYDAIEEFIVAGAFGTYLDIGSALRIGMFPTLPIERFRQVGNAAGTGARQMLISSKRREMTEEIAARVEYLELTTNPEFTTKFMKSMIF
ncbi:MAG TPA: DUF4445 domain-containing protein [Anaerolineae bacterium]|nr:DUF4445 domain-containing protein [Anaerolineae bacterium]